MLLSVIVTFVLSVPSQVVEEGIRAGNVPAVLQKCVNDLLDLTDLVRGKLTVQVNTFPIQLRNRAPLFEIQHLHLVVQRHTKHGSLHHWQPCMSRDYRREGQYVAERVIPHVGCHDTMLELLPRQASTRRSH